jgi:hypothetical protein
VLFGETRAQVLVAFVEEAAEPAYA